MFGYRSTTIVTKRKGEVKERKRLIFLLTFSFLSAGCTINNVSSDISPPDSTSVPMLPPQLQGQPLSFDKVLQSYDWLNDKQKIAVLEHLLGQNHLNDRQKAEVAYMLARLAQQSADRASQTTVAMTGEQTLKLFEEAQTYPPLKAKSLWHKSEIAAMLGKEKLVRQTLTAFLAQAKDSADIAAAQYALAQSYVRASETNNACKLLNKIRADFPGTDYAIGAGYYLGTLSYNQFEQKSSSQHNYPRSGLFKLFGQNSAPEPLKDACTYYSEYLLASPGGHFTPDILLKLENLAVHNFWQPKESELVLMAIAYSTIGQYKSSLACWQKAGISKHLLAVSSCLVRLRQFSLAQEKFFQGLANNSHDKHCLAIANEISSHLNAAGCLHFWQQLRRSKFAFQDEVLWNIAIRNSSTEALHYYQDLLAHYPQSIHAPEAQWWILWHKFKSTKTSLAPAMAGLFYRAAIKYNHCPLTPRFLFWAGKISENTSDKQGANFYYQQALRLCPAGYYGQRANARLNFITNIAPDNYFSPQYHPPSTAPNDYFRPKYHATGIAPDDYFRTNYPSPSVATTSAISSTLIWDCPPPEKAIDAAKQKGWLTLYELIYIKQYAEALADNNRLTPELTAWLEGKCGQPWLAINTASRCLEEKSCPISDPDRLRQYAFPLLYNREIVSGCKNTLDPLLVQALVREESRYNPNAVSEAQAVGLCQLMPATANGIAKNIGIRIANKEQLFQTDLNLALGIAYLSSALKTFGNDGLPAIASYNSGINAVKNFLASKQGRLLADPDQFVEDFPFRETRDYMRKVFASYWHYKQIYYQPLR